MTLGSQVFSNAARYDAAEMRLIAFSYHSITSGHHLGLRRAYTAAASRAGRRRFDGQEFGQEL
jgi:hypothetical protein